MLEFDGVGRKARVVRVPRRFAHLDLGDRWFSRRELFEAVDAAMQSVSSADSSRDESDFEDQQGSQAPIRKDAVPLTVLAGVLTLGCLCAAAAAVMALGVFLSNSWQSGDAPAASGMLAAAPTIDAQATPLAEQALAAEQPPPAADSPAADGAIPPSPQPASEAQPSEPLPTPPPPESQDSAPPTIEAPPVEEPAQPLPTPPPSLLESPLPAPPAEAAPPESPPLPPTFTPPAAVEELPTLQPVTPTPTFPAPPTAPPPTPGPPPSATPVYVPGVVRTQGELVLEIQWGAEDIVVVQNMGVQPVSLYGMKLRAIAPAGVIPNVAPNDPRLEFFFPNGAVILGNQECKVYVHDLRPSDPCPFDWSAAAGVLWPDLPNKGVTVALVDADGQEWVRITY